MTNNKGNIIAELRKEAGYTQKSLAEALFITDKAVSKWERGLSLPDASLLAKLSLLLDADISLLLAHDGKHPNEGWCGLIDLRNFEVDLSQIVYDKPMVYFMLSHFLLLGISKICVLTSKENQDYLQSNIFADLGLEIFFDFTKCTNNLMILTQPCFLFGSDLTRQFQSAMISHSVTKLVPDNMHAPFIFCPVEYAPIYWKHPDSLYELATARTLGRGMVCINMDCIDSSIDVANFVRMYQKYTGLLIGSLEEIAYKKGLINKEKLLETAKAVPYMEQLKSLVDTVK